MFSSVVYYNLCILPEIVVKVGSFCSVIVLDKSPLVLDLSNHENFYTYYQQLRLYYSLLKGE